MFRDLIENERRWIKIRNIVQLATEIVGLAILSASLVAIIVLAQVLVWN